MVCGTSGSSQGTPSEIQIDKAVNARDLVIATQDSLIHVVERIGPSASSLPSDVLLLVFALLGITSSVLEASWVCRYWRAVITTSPALWTYIPTHNLDLARLFLKRSATLPVNLTVGYGSNGSSSEHTSMPADGDMAALLQDHLERIQTLHICEDLDLEDSDGDIVGVLRAWARFFSHHGPLPILQDLTISLAHAGNPVPATRGRHTRTLHRHGQRFWAADGPSPRTLCLIAVLFSPPCAIYANLAILSISHGYIVPLPDFLQILQASPDLRDLRLKRWGVTQLDYRPPAGPIPFPHLTRLTLENIAHAAVIALLDCLALPAGLTHFHYDADMEGEDNKVFPMPRQTLAPTATIGRFVFTGHDDWDEIPEDSCSAHAYRSASPGPHDERTVKMYLPLCLQETSLLDIVRWLAPNIAHAECLVLADIWPAISSDAWRTGVLAQMPRLKTICICGCLTSTIPLLEALSTAPLLCPDLAVLEVSEFPGYEPGDISSHREEARVISEPDIAALWAALDAVVAARRAMDVPLRKLALFDVPRPPDAAAARRVGAGVDTFRCYIQPLPPNKNKIVGYGFLGRKARLPWIGGYGAIPVEQIESLLVAYDPEEDVDARSEAGQQIQPGWGGSCVYEGRAMADV